MYKLGSTRRQHSTLKKDTLHHCAFPVTVKDTGFCVIWLMYKLRSIRRFDSPVFKKKNCSWSHFFLDQIHERKHYRNVLNAKIVILACSIRVVRSMSLCMNSIRNDLFTVTFSIILYSRVVDAFRDIVRSLARHSTCLHLDRNGWLFIY